MVKRNAVATQDRARRAADRDGLPDVVELAERDLLRAQAPSVLEPPGPQRDQHPLLDLEHHVDQLVLGQLERTPPACRTAHAPTRSPGPTRKRRGPRPSRPT